MPTKDDHQQAEAQIDALIAEHIGNTLNAAALRFALRVIIRRCEVHARRQALEPVRMLFSGKCPDGGGPQCVCRCLGEPYQCVSIRALLARLPEDPDGDER